MKKLQETLIFVTITASLISFRRHLTSISKRLKWIMNAKTNFNCTYLSILNFLRFSFQQNACGAKIGICRALLNKPDVVSIGVVWDSERPAADQVHSVLKAIGTSLRLGDVFHQVSDTRWAHLNSHELVGVVSYYGKHYTTFFFHTKLKVWVYFDDANVQEVSLSSE